MDFCVQKKKKNFLYEYNNKSSFILGLNIIKKC